MQYTKRILFWFYLGSFLLLCSFCIFDCTIKSSKIEFHEFKVAVENNFDKYGHWFIIKEQFLFKKNCNAGKKNASLYLCVDNKVNDTLYIVSPCQDNKFKHDSYVILQKNQDISNKDSISIRIPNSYLEKFEKSKKLFGNVYIPLD